MSRTLEQITRTTHAAAPPSATHTSPTVGPLLTRKETMERLRLKAAHFSKLVNGKVKGLPPLPVVRIGRRQLFREEAVQQWIIDVETKTCSAGR